MKSRTVSVVAAIIIGLWAHACATTYEKSPATTFTPTSVADASVPAPEASNPASVVVDNTPWPRAPEAEPVEINESQYAAFDNGTVSDRSHGFWCVEEDCYPRQNFCEVFRRELIDSGGAAPPACTRATEVWCFSTTNVIRRTSIGICSRQTERASPYAHCVSKRRVTMDDNRYVTRWRNISQCVRVLGGAP
jgi:hypothetical protein